MGCEREFVGKWRRWVWEGRLAGLEAVEVEGLGPREAVVFKTC